MRTVKRYFKHLVLFPSIIATLQILSFVKQVLTSFASFVIQRKEPHVVRTPEERFRGLEAVGYTFKPNYVDLPVGGGRTLPRVHYVDEVMASFILQTHLKFLLNDTP
ncbi:putative Haloalkane dehalogenase-like 2, partial [Homarus americanus]